MTRHFINDELATCDEHPDWGLVLQAYRNAQTDSDLGWIGRLPAVPGVPSDRLSPIHGRLIALGLLRFDLEERSTGLRYQLTPLGRQAALPPSERQLVPDWLPSDDDPDD